MVTGYIFKQLTRRGPKENERSRSDLWLPSFQLDLNPVCNTLQHVAYLVVLSLSGSFAKYG